MPHFSLRESSSKAAVIVLPRLIDHALKVLRDGCVAPSKLFRSLKGFTAREANNPVKAPSPQALHPDPHW